MKRKKGPQGNGIDQWQNRHNAEAVFEVGLGIIGALISPYPLNLIAILTFFALAFFSWRTGQLGWKMKKGALGFRYNKPHMRQKIEEYDEIMDKHGLNYSIAFYKWYDKNGNIDPDLLAWRKKWYKK